MMINIFQSNKDSLKMIMFFRIIQPKAHIQTVSIIPNWNMFTVNSSIRIKNHNFHIGNCVNCNITVQKHHTLWKTYIHCLNFLKAFKTWKSVSDKFYRSYIKLNILYLASLYHLLALPSYHHLHQNLLDAYLCVVRCFW